MTIEQTSAATTYPILLTDGEMTYDSRTVDHNQHCDLSNQLWYHEIKDCWWLWIPDCTDTFGVIPPSARL